MQFARVDVVERGEVVRNGACILSGLKHSVWKGDFRISSCLSEWSASEWSTGRVLSTRCDTLADMSIP